MSDTATKATIRTDRPAQQPEEPDEEQEKKRETRPRRPELRAMHAIDGILEDMDPAARSRVVTWLVSVHGFAGFLGLPVPDLNDPRR